MQYQSQHRGVPSRVRLIAVWGVSMLVLGSMAWTPARALDAGSCAALRAAGSKFELGLVECDVPAAATQAPRPLPRESHAQQLYLFERPPTAAASQPEAASGRAPAAPDQPAAQPMRPAPVRPAMPASLARALRWAPTVDRIAADHALDPLLLHAIARIESRHDPLAVSQAGARGLMQVMPATGARFGVGDAQALHDAPTNLEVSARYLQLLERRFAGQLPLVLAAYNAGEGAVERHGRRIPPYAETRDYVRKVLHEYERLRSVSARLAAAPELR